MNPQQSAESALHQPERRAQPRTPASYRALLRINDGMHWRMRVENMSLSGALLGPDPEAPAPRVHGGEFVELQILDPAEHYAGSVASVVVRVADDGHRFAVRFSDVSHFTRRWLQRLIEGAVPG